MLINGQDADNIKLGNTLSQDAFPDKKFDYMISTPPYGDDKKKSKSVEEVVVKEHEEKGFNERFGAGVSKALDERLLFVKHLVSKMKPVTNENPKGSRIAIITSGSPLFTGDAGQGESEIRKWLIENDLVEGIVALPKEVFGKLVTYIWILTNNKSQKRKGKIQLVNAVDFYEKMKKKRRR